MWIRQLKVQHFKGIRSASLAFGPGLNVLHGPNELGKSSLVHAIRAALLLPDSSSARKDFVDWHADQPPQVALVFETEPNRIWRVRKSFGSGAEGWSYLEFSKDGVTFGQEAKGREVDGRLRELLRWGIEGPGGRTRTRGLPDSFLATALLADQKDVEAVLRRGLDDDGDDSGRQRLTEALQALAQDPVFRRVVEAAQARVDEAFTSTGRRRTGRGSPWVDLRDQRRQVTARQAEVRAQVEESRGAEQRVAQLRDAIDAARERSSEAREALEAAEAAWEKQKARCESEGKVRRARAQRDRVAELHAEVAKTEAELQERQRKLKAAEERRQAAEARYGETVAGLEEARGRLRELLSGDAEQKRRLEEEQIGKALVELEAREKEAHARGEKAAGVGALEDKARAVRDEMTRRAQSVAEAETDLEAVQRRLDGDRRAMEAVDEQQRVLRLLAARRALAQAEDDAAAVEEQRERAEESRAQARRIREEVRAAGLPGKEEMEALEVLARGLEVAEAALAVGLSVTVRAVRKLDVAVAVDGEEAEEEAAASDEKREERELAAGSEARMEAQRRVRLRLKDLADVEVSGGSAERRAAAKKLREDWDGRTREVFARAQVESLEQLAEKTRAAAAREDEAAAHEASAIVAEARVEGAGDVQAALRSAEAQLDRAEARVTAALVEGDRFEDVVSRWAQAVATDEDESTRLRLEDEVERRERQVGELRTACRANKAVLESKAPQLEALEKEASAAAAAVGDDWKAVREAAVREAETAAKERTERLAELDDLRSQGTAEHDQAREAVETGEAALAAARTDLEAARESERESRTRVDEFQGALRAQRDSADREDLPAAEAVLEQCLTELESHPDPATPVTEDQFAGARATVGKLDTEHQHLQSEYQKAEGALQQVGGQYIQERLQQVEEHLQALADRERETELDYAAWQLLLETVKESEREDAGHLGKALVDPIAKRMSELTGGRYTGLGIGPKLKTQGLEVAGVSRELSSLSVGTREQLATVLRLTIAEVVKSVLVLDDQLVQSDAERMRWLVAFMTECAKEFQILVFTCRPEEYQVDGEGEMHHRQVKLDALVERSGRE